jgi:UDP-N-acetylglucosamine--N-acetylmuramyl-(pentapeptide) pyrophosphoryl-undecaprenol N-acetylglucosamine transferase
VKILFYAVNGIGLGHVARLSVIERYIGEHYPHVHCVYHSNSPHAASFFSCSGAYGDDRQHCRALIDAVLRMEPDVVVCDSLWPEGAIGPLARRGIRTVLVLRLPDRESAQFVFTQALHEFHQILIPGSSDELRQVFAAGSAFSGRMLTEPRVCCVGPIARVRRRAVAPGRGTGKRILFALGAGGDYPNAPEGARVATLLAACARVAAELGREGIPLAVIRGPFAQFQDLVALQAVDEPVLWTVRMTFGAHEYMDENTVVVARPGYGTPWEALAAGARLVIIGECAGYQEDPVARAVSWEARGLAVRSTTEALAATLRSVIAAGWDPVMIRELAGVNEGLPLAAAHIVERKVL